MKQTYKNQQVQYKIVLRESKINIDPKITIAAHLYWSLEDINGKYLAELHGYGTKDDEPMTVAYNGFPLKAFLYSIEQLFKFDEKYSKTGPSPIFNGEDNVRAVHVGNTEIFDKWEKAIDAAKTINEGKGNNLPYKYDLVVRNSNSVAKTLADAMDIALGSCTLTPGDQYNVFDNISEEEKFQSGLATAVNTVGAVLEQTDNCVTF